MIFIDFTNVSMKLQIIFPEMRMIYKRIEGIENTEPDVSSKQAETFLNWSSQTPYMCDKYL